MYVAVIEGVIHYTLTPKDGYQEVKGSTQLPQQVEEELRNKITILQEQQNTTDAAVQELILEMAEV